MLVFLRGEFTVLTEFVQIVSLLWLWSTVLRLFLLFQVESGVQFLWVGWASLILTGFGWTCLTSRSSPLTWEWARSLVRVYLFIPNSAGRFSEWGLGVFEWVRFVEVYHFILDPLWKGKVFPLVECIIIVLKKQGELVEINKKIGSLVTVLHDELF